MNEMTTMRELDRREVEQLSGGNPIVAGLAIGTLSGGIVGGLAYGYDSAMSGADFSWSLFSGAVAQGAITGFLITGGGYLFAVPGGVVAGVVAEGTAAVITMTDPYKSLE